MVPAGKSPARGVAPPMVIELPTTHIVLSRTPASINIDADDDDEEATHSNDPRLITPCVVVSSIVCDGGSSSPSSSSSGAALTAVCGHYWFSCPQGLLEAANAIAASSSAKRSAGDFVVSSSASHGFDALPSDVCSPLSSLHEVVESLLSDSGTNSKSVSGGKPMPTTPTIFLALSSSSFRVYAMVTADGSSPADAPRDDEKIDITAEPPSIPRTRGGAKEKMTSAVAFDFVSGIMKSVVGDNVDSLFATDSKEE